MTNTVASTGASRQKPVMLAQTAPAFTKPKYESDSSATRVDTALLVSMLFLQRFTLPFGATFLHLDFVGIVVILLYQFLNGKVVIQYDRLLWFLAFAFANTCSLLLNFERSTLTSYSGSIVIYSFFMLSRASTPDQYRRTLQAFQFLVMLIACLAIVQFPAQFVLDSHKLIRFYGIVPDILLGIGEEGPTRGYNTSASLGGGLVKSNGIFLNEPSGMSQVSALGILIEVLEFRRPRYLLIMGLGFLLAYSGTGLMLLFLFLPLATLRHDKALPYVLLVVIFALGLFATGVIHLSNFTSRVGEFEAVGSSGFGRFVSPFWAAAQQFDLEALQALLFGSGPGTAKFGTHMWFGWANYNTNTWIKIFHEYGIIGSFIFACFMAGCLRRSRCPGLVIAAQMFAFLFLQGMIDTAIVLCTLNGPGPRRAPVDETNEYRSSRAASFVVGR
jgi:hypothetical protein